MSVRAIVAQLSGAKQQLLQAKQVGGHYVTTATEAAHMVSTVLDGVQDKALSDSIARQSKAVADAFDRAASSTAGIDAAIRRFQGIGAGGR